MIVSKWGWWRKKNVVDGSLVDKFLCYIMPLKALRKWEIDFLS